MNDSKEIDYNKLDKTVLALLWHGCFKFKKTDPHPCAYKSYDWDIMNRLHEQGYISDPQSKAKSVLLTEKGEEASRQLFEELFKTEGTD